MKENKAHAKTVEIKAVTGNVEWSATMEGRGGEKEGRKEGRVANR